MKLATQSVPYRTFQKVSGLLVLLVFLGIAGSWSLPAAAGLAGAAVLAAGAYEVAYWQRFDYALTDDTLDIASGVISRREREIPYGRIQNVDVSRSVVQRALGIAAVDLETAGGSSTEGSIRYVTPDEATRIQREVQRRKAAAKREGDADAATAEAGTADGRVDDRDAALDEIEEEELFSISPGELALVGALSFDGRLLGLLVFGVPLVAGGSYSLGAVLPEGSATLVTATALVGLGLLLFASWILGAAVTFSNYYGFRLSRAGDELRYERGLFRRYSGSIPTEKVQSLTITDNPAKRLLGYASLSIETAGYAPGQGGDYGSQAAVPIASRERVLRLAREVEAFEEPDYTRPPGRIRLRYAFRYTLVVAALVGVAFAVNWWVGGAYPWYATAGLLVGVPAAAHLKWKHRGYDAGEDHLLTRDGFWSRRTKVVPHYRIQNVIDTRSFFQRRWGVATVIADTAGTGSLTGSDAVAYDIETADAERLREDLTDRLQEALVERRAERTGFEWGDGDGGDGGDDATVDDATVDDGAVAGGSPPPESAEAADPEAPASGDEAPTTDEGTAVSEAEEAEGVDKETEEADTGADDETTAIPEAEGAEGVEAADEEPSDVEAPPEGVVTPDFSTSDRDFSEPAETVDTGDYAVDHKPSDTDVAHGVGAADEGENGEDDADATDENGEDDTDR
ncbi:hypothetical protein JCM17823_08570 [Halorubrum gandharaense]